MPALINRRFLIRCYWFARGPFPENQKRSAQTKRTQYKNDDDDQANDVDDLIHFIRPIASRCGF